MPVRTEPRGKLQAVIRVASGNFLEMYDFLVFAYVAKQIGAHFFPVESPFARLMLAFLTFAAGFLMRPLGALVLGPYIDRVGRRRGLMLTLGLMSLGTLSLAVTPGFATIGWAAPVIVLLGRLLQGFSAGVELGGVSVYLAEIATPGHRGFYVSWQSGSQQVAVMLAAGLGILLDRTLPAGAMDEWGWRIPLLVGCLIVPVLFVLRRSLEETEAFLARKQHPDAAQIYRTIARNWPIVLAGMMLVTPTTVLFYFITAYTPTFGQEVLKLAPVATLVVTLCVAISNLIWLPVMGALSDRIGRAPLLILFTLLALITAPPALVWLGAGPTFGRLMLVELWLSFLYASYNGAMVVHLTEIMPEAVRTAGFSLAYSLATALFGGMTPAVATLLQHMTGNRAAAGAWLALAALLGFGAALATHRREAEPAALN